MPIRFRCAYCNQLMGIARRKAGTVVRCPRCAGQVIVPDPGPDAAKATNGPGPEPPPAAANGPGLFEQSDFEKLFEPGPSVPPPVPVPAPPPMPAAAAPQLVSPPPLPAAPQFASFAPPQPLAPQPVAQQPAAQPMPFPANAEFDVEPLPAYGAPPPAAGLFLTPAKLTILSVSVVILLGLAFFLGMLVGRA